MILRRSRVNTPLTKPSQLPNELIRTILQLATTTCWLPSSSFPSQDATKLRYRELSSHSLINRSWGASAQSLLFQDVVLVGSASLDQLDKFVKICRQYPALATQVRNMAIFYSAERVDNTSVKAMVDWSTFLYLLVTCKNLARLNISGLKSIVLEDLLSKSLEWLLLHQCTIMPPIDSTSLYGKGKHLRTLDLAGTCTESQEETLILPTYFTSLARFGVYGTGIKLLQSRQLFAASAHHLQSLVVGSDLYHALLQLTASPLQPLHLPNLRELRFGVTIDEALLLLCSLPTSNQITRLIIRFAYSGDKSCHIPKLELELFHLCLFLESKDRLPHLKSLTLADQGDWIGLEGEYRIVLGYENVERSCAVRKMEYAYVNVENPVRNKVIQPIKAVKFFSSLSTPR